VAVIVLKITCFFSPIIIFRKAPTVSLDPISGVDFSGQLKLATYDGIFTLVLDLNVSHNIQTTRIRFVYI
jgi:hypothetical protein